MWVTVHGECGKPKVLDPLEVTVTDAGELPCGCWEPNSGALQEQHVLMTTDPCLGPHQLGF